MHPELIETLRDAQRLGMFGDGAIEDAVEHAGGFVDALGELRPGSRVIDLGSGGGLPGLVLADAYRDAAITLLDRRQKRTDFLARAVSRLGWSHVTVRTDDVRTVIDDVVDGRLAPFDVVTARGFGPPEFTLRAAVGIVASRGRIVVSEPPSGDRWDRDVLTELGVAGERVGAVRVFHRA